MWPLWLHTCCHLNTKSSDFSDCDTVENTGKVQWLFVLFSKRRNCRQWRSFYSTLKQYHSLQTEWLIVSHRDYLTPSHDRFWSLFWFSWGLTLRQPCLKWFVRSVSSMKNVTFVHWRVLIIITIFFSVSSVILCFDI